MLVKCDNPRCEIRIGGPTDSQELVLLVTTANRRLFCSLDCAVESRRLHLETLAAEVGLGPQR
jgi:hypothetical protein